MAKYLRLDAGLCLAVALLAVTATGRHPYNYYVLLRWCACGMAGYTAWRLHNSGKQGLTAVFIGLAILFNPIGPFRFQRGTWAGLDLLGSVLFLFAAYLTPTFRPLTVSHIRPEK